MPVLFLEVNRSAHDAGLLITSPETRRVFEYFVTKQNMRLLMSTLVMYQSALWRTSCLGSRAEATQVSAYGWLQKQTTFDKQHRLGRFHQSSALRCNLEAC